MERYIKTRFLLLSFIFFWHNTWWNGAFGLGNCANCLIGIYHGMVQASIILWVNHCRKMHEKRQKTQCYWMLILSTAGHIRFGQTGKTWFRYSILVIQKFDQTSQNYGKLLSRCHWASMHFICMHDVYLHAVKRTVWSLDGLSVMKYLSCKYIYFNNIGLFFTAWYKYIIIILFLDRSLKKGNYFPFVPNMIWRIILSIVNTESNKTDLGVPTINLRVNIFIFYRDVM